VRCSPTCATPRRSHLCGLLRRPGRTCREPRILQGDSASARQRP
jgi:hypothetical protein